MITDKSFIELFKKEFFSHSSIEHILINKVIPLDVILSISYMNEYISDYINYSSATKGRFFSHIADRIVWRKLNARVLGYSGVFDGVISDDGSFSRRNTLNEKTHLLLNELFKNNNVDDLYIRNNTGYITFEKYYDSDLSFCDFLNNNLNLEKVSFSRSTDTEMLLRYEDLSFSDFEDAFKKVKRKSGYMKERAAILMRALKSFHINESLSFLISENISKSERVGVVDTAYVAHSALRKAKKSYQNWSERKNIVSSEYENFVESNIDILENIIAYNIDAIAQGYASNFISECKEETIPLIVAKSDALTYYEKKGLERRINNK